MNKIFIVGFPRSGTTLLQTLIVSSSGAFSLPETHLFFREFVQPFDRFLFSPNFADKFWIHRKGRGLSDLGRALRNIREWTEFNGENKEDLVRKFLRFMDVFAEKNGNLLWVEKTPGHIRRIPVIKKYCSDAKFVHIIRRFSAVERSWEKASSFYNSPFMQVKKKIYRNWERDLRRSLYWATADPKNHFVVLYPQLCLKTEHSIQKILKFFKIKYFSDACSLGNDRILLDDEYWKENNKRAVLMPGVNDLIGKEGDLGEVFFNMALEKLNGLENVFI